MKERPAMTFVRDAGPAAMATTASDWDLVDESSDESFPASDPPSRTPARRDEPGFQSPSPLMSQGVPHD